MMNRGQIEWQDSEKELYDLYRDETAVEVKPRFQALWLLSSGRRRGEVAEIVGINQRTLRDWIAWYRHGGVAEVHEHRKGNHTGRAAWLSKEQESQIREHAGQGEFYKIEDVQIWVEETFGIYYTYWGMRHVLDRLNIHRHVPRPLSSKADPAVQESWKKGDSQKLLLSGVRHGVQ